VFWRIVISSVGAALIVIAIVSIFLFFFGESTTADVNTRRVGGASHKRLASQRYEWSLDYDFKDKQGNTYNGHSTRCGSDISVKAENKVYYFAFAPFINTLESEAEPNAMQLLFIVIGLLLIFQSIRKNEKGSSIVK